MTYEIANTHMKQIAKTIRGTCRSARQAKRCAERYAVKHNLKVKDGNPAIIYESGSERVILFYVKANGGIHMDIVTNPAYAFLDEFDLILFA